MSVSLVYDDGQQSRHPRYRIPATAEIEGWRYPVQEWSLDGFAVAGVHDVETLSGTFPARLWFRFDGFSTVVDVNVEVVRRDPEDDGITCRFSDLSNQKVAVLRAVVDSYLLGEFVSVDDLIHVVRRDALEDHPDEHAGARGETDGTRIGALLRRWLGLGTLCVLLGLLVALTTWTAYRRLYVVDAASAVVAAPLVIIRAPQPSFFSAVGPADRTRVARGEPLALAALIGGGATTIDSPCECTIVRRHALDGEFVSLGEPLMTLLPLGAKAHVSAKVPIEGAQRIAIGDRATLRLPDRTSFEGTVRQVLFGESLERSLATPLGQTRTEVISYHEVIIEPAVDLNLDLLGVPATVEIRTFRGL